MQDNLWQTNYEEPDMGFIYAVQEKLHIIFPAEYINCLLKYHGGFPSRRYVKIKNYGPVIFDSLLVFIPFDELDIFDKYNIVRFHISDRVFPFAIDKKGNYFCFDYRESDASPPIYYWNEKTYQKIGFDEKMYYCSDSFSSFLNMLVTIEEI